jgi:hypothetical protein
VKNSQASFFLELKKYHLQIKPLHKDDAKEQVSFFVPDDGSIPSCKPTNDSKDKTP